MFIKSLGVTAMTAYLLKTKKEAKCWIYRDDIGAHWGIKGYEEQVTEVGSSKGHVEHYFPQYRRFGTWDSGSLRRGWQVFSKNCANCHGMQYRKYDVLLDKGYKQSELQNLVTMFSINPGHHHYKQYYYQEWDDRDRVITDHIYMPYLSQDQAKKANGGVLPVDFSKIFRRPGNIMYIYNVLTGYHFKPPFGMDVPKGKYFNPYFDHMIIGMPRQLHDGMIDYDDGTPSSTPQMAYDVSNYLTYMQRRVGAKMPDKKFKFDLLILGFLLLAPLRYVAVHGKIRGYLVSRFEAYAVRDGNYYKHFRTGQKSLKAPFWRGVNWA